MESINEKLNKLYYSKVNGFNKIMERVDDEEFGSPLLMYCWEDLYSKTRHKLLIVGKETNGWKKEGDSIESSIDKTKKFELAKKYYNRSKPFFKSAFAINSSLNLGMENENCFLWTNVSKCDSDNSSLNWDQHKFIVDNFDVLQEEIEVTKPDVVVFFSGPSYDDKIQIQFDNELQFESIIPDIPCRELARVIHPNKLLPEHSYRTYHPNYSYRSGRPDYTSLITCLINGIDVSNKLISFQQQIKDFTKEMKLEICDESFEDFGKQYSGFWFYKKEWKYCCIGFEFGKAWAKDFYWGIERRHVDEEIPEDIAKNIMKNLENSIGNCGDNSPNLVWWPWWDWYITEDGKDYKNWNEATFAAIENGTLQNDIKIKVEKILHSLEGIAL